MEQHTKFEKPRGVNKISVRDGYVQVHISGWDADRAQLRVEALQAFRDAGISIDFLKLTRSGMSFLVKEDASDEISKLLEASQPKFSVKKHCSVVLAHAVNIRDEEGLVASIMKATIDGGFKVHHISDMHDRVLMVVDTDQAQSLADKLHARVGVSANAR